jgi:large repetitive protein
MGGVLKTFTVEVADGNIDTDLVSTGLSPKINGSEIIRQPDQGPETADLTINFSLQNRTNIDGNYTIALYEVNDLSNPAYQFTPTVSGESAMELTDLTPGDYAVKVKEDRFLQKSINATLAFGMNTVSLGEMLGGDANDDNGVELSDFSILAATYELLPGEPGFDIRADYNGDGAINLTDFSILAANYNQVGEQ